MRESFPVAFPPGLPVAHGGTPTFQFSSSIRAKDKLAAGPGGQRGVPSDRLLGPRLPRHEATSLVCDAAGRGIDWGAVKTFHSALVVIPPEELWEPIQRIRRRFDRHVSRWMPHVTLLYPFRPKEAFDEAEGQVRAAVAGIAPFDVTLAEFRSFAHGPESHTMWLHPDPPEPFLRLHAALLAAFPDCDDAAKYENGFTPHLSVGQARLPRDLEERLRLIRTGWASDSFEVRELALLAREGEGEFRVERTVELGKG